MTTAESAPTRNACDQGREIFRYDTFGDDQLWTDLLRMHEAIATVPPATALAVDLKVDVDALPKKIISALRAGQVDLTDPAVTVELLRRNAVVGVRGNVSRTGQLASVGIRALSAIPRSTNHSLRQSAGGWTMGEYGSECRGYRSSVACAGCSHQARVQRLGTGQIRSAPQAFDGTKLLVLNTPSLPIVLPPIYGLNGVGFETFSADGTISYWNGYVGVGQMGGQGTFGDPRIDLLIGQSPDLVTPKLPALLARQLSLSTATPAGSFNRGAAKRGERLFRNEAGCAGCHQSPHFADVLSGPDPTVPFLHDPAEVGLDPGYADRTATGQYRTTPLQGLWQHPPYFHDGSAPDLLAVVDHYDKLFGLKLKKAQKADLIEFLKSL